VNDAELDALNPEDLIVTIGFDQGSIQLVWADFHKKVLGNPAFSETVKKTATLTNIQTVAELKREREIGKSD
jgi:hypothetical protein